MQQQHTQLEAACGPQDRMRCCPCGAAAGPREAASWLRRPCAEAARLLSCLASFQVEMVQHIKREHPGLDVICGNVVTSWQVRGSCRTGPCAHALLPDGTSGPVFHPCQLPAACCGLSSRCLLRLARVMLLVLVLPVPFCVRGRQLQLHVAAGKWGGAGDEPRVCPYHPTTL